MISCTKLIFDGPHLKKYAPFDFYTEGCSPKLLNYIIDFLEENKDRLSEINIAIYLFNNLTLFEKLKEIALSGITVNVISIPLDGYSKHKAKKIIDRDTKKIIFNDTSKYDLAKAIYIESNHVENFNLYIYDHVYLKSRFVKDFSRGGAPYSLHIKTFLFTFKNGQSYSFLTSSNLAVRDLVKEELLLSFKNSAYFANQSQLFFKHLIENAIANPLYVQGAPLSKTHYPIRYSSPPKRIGSFFLAAFYEHSPKIAEYNIKRILNRAKKRVIIVAQHITEFIDILEGIDHENIDVNILSQTYADETLKKNEDKSYVTINGQEVGCRTPLNVKKFKLFSQRFKQLNIGNYYFNNYVHLKFIVVDNLVILSTGNFTSTQFDYIHKVDIDNFKHMPRQRYKGTFSEVNHYVFLDNRKDLADELDAHFSKLINQTSSIHAICKR